MPIASSAYNPPHIFKNGHFATIYAGLLREVHGVRQTRERIDTSDGDFLDLDWSFADVKTQKLIIILHGLEGNAQRPYITGTAKIFNANGFDACAVNLRGCSGEPNRLFRSYHSGVSEDLNDVIKYVISHKDYQTIIIKGFSLGGNVTLKYLGEINPLPPQIKAGIAVSVPCLLKGSMLELHKFKNVLYSKRFRKDLVGKLKEKQRQFPEKITSEEVRKIITLKDFDDVYTSKAHGFEDAWDYYEKSSSLPHLENIQVPTFILNAKNDSFLSPECFPFEVAAKKSNIHLETPNYGGHVGFYDKNNIYYNEKRALSFVKEFVK